MFNYVTKSEHIMNVPAEYLERVSRHGAEKESQAEAGSPPELR